MNVDLATVDALADEMAPFPANRSSRVPPFVTDADDALLDAMCRWVELIRCLQDVGVLARRYEEEVLYRVLTGPLGSVLLAAARRGESAAIRRVVRFINQNFADNGLRVDDLAAESGLSPAAFYRLFKMETGSSPSRYIKTVRLQRARALLAAGNTAAQAASRVGYLSSAHFSRDYATRYGLPPRAHVREARATF